ncbi:hypothetical protein F5Y19DRAFT_38807 [Xylariaceae sp. FL1651]|nr:hypothetical protein F5Y19DRAFT_38807 [Xylariaceae sp. FL1651]
MLPSTSASSSSTDRPAPVSAASTESRFPRRHPATRPTYSSSAAAAVAAAPDSGPGAPLSKASSPYKRGPSSSVDGQSPDSSTSQLGGRDHVSAVPEDQRTKKRRTGPGSRGVANLTPEQLAKKRANDREAQRAIRERTKNQIEALENRIRELTSQQPYQELQKVIQQKEAVEAENAEIRRHLASIMALIQPFLLNQQAEGAYASPVPTYVPTHPNQHPPPTSYATHNTSPPRSTASPASGVEPPWHNPALSQSSLHSHQIKMLNQQRHDLTHNLDFGPGEQLKLDFLLDRSQRVSKLQTGVNGAQDSPAFQHLPMKQRIEYPPGPSNSVQVPWVDDNPAIKNSEPTCPLDGLLLHFLHERRQRAAEGVPTQEIVGPRYPSVSSLLNPANSAYSHPLSNIFTDILAKFPGIDTLPEKIAVLYVMFLIMRWQINPTDENYNLMPPLARPVSAQLDIPHPAWIDHLPFPGMRERLVHQYNSGEPSIYFDDFFIPFTTTLSLNWPYEETDALIQSPDGSELLINPVFERHIRKGENWTLGDAFDKTFPGLSGTYNLKRDDGTSNENSGRNNQ